MEKIPGPPSVGADPEVFLKNTETGNMVVACGLIGGTKERPRQLPKMEKGFAVQEDNVMLEFNIPPAYDEDTVYNYIHSAMRAITKEVGNIDPYLTPAWGVESHKFLAKDLRSQQAQQFGCDPDMNAYTGGAFRPNPATKLGNVRTAGGHIHIGGDFHCPDFVAALTLEYMLLVYSGAKISGGGIRANTYGAPGSYRSKPYGIEYRTPSNIWLSDTRYGASGIMSLALQVARWLSTTDATRIRTFFRSVEWTKQERLAKHLLVVGGLTPELKKVRTELISQGKKGGFLT